MYYSVLDPGYQMAGVMRVLTGIGLFTLKKAVNVTHQRRHTQAVATQGCSPAMIIFSIAVAIATVSLVMPKRR